MRVYPLDNPSFQHRINSDAPINLLIAVTGSVATVKLPNLIAKLLETTKNIQIKVVPTERAKHFFDVSQLPSTIQIISDSDEWSSFSTLGDPILHIDLRNWADIMVIAPLDANTMTKMSIGLCDNLLTCIIRAWDISKPIIISPAMNTAMWENPLTSRSLALLMELGCYYYIPPIHKTLACGDVGNIFILQVPRLLCAFGSF
eukprot:Sdes_comp18070_c0_seq8m7470